MEKVILELSLKGLCVDSPDFEGTGTHARERDL